MMTNVRTSPAPPLKRRGYVSMQKENKTTQPPAKKGLKRLNWIMGFALLGIVVATGFVYFTFAALVSNMTDTMSNQGVSGAAMHTISFNLSGGNTFMNGEQIAVDFPQAAAFVEGGTWATADFTFADGTARVIDAVYAAPGANSVACGNNGPNSVGVAIDTTALTFRVIPCGAGFTPSAAGAFITFTVNGALPGGVLFNPAAPGTYKLYVINGAGDCAAGGELCSMSVAVIDPSSISVTATVPSQCGNGIVNVGESCDDGNLINSDGCSMYCSTEGVGGSGAIAVVPAPIITNIRATDITETTATVRWDTDQGTNSRVNYGLTSTYTAQANGDAFVTKHDINLSSLIVGALYHYQVCSTNSSSSQTCSIDQTFSTVDQTPPIFSNQKVTAISCSGATISWNTDENASQMIDYGTTTYTKNAGSTTPLQKTHSVVLTGLNKNTVYHYRVHSSDAAMNEALGNDEVFSTSFACEGDTTPPTITNVQAVSITGTTATITWDTDENTTSAVDFGISITYGGNVWAETLAKTHSMVLTGLTPGTMYHFRVTSKDVAKNQAISSDNFFSTTTAEPCKVDCKDVLFAPYIINPDGSERKSGTDFVLIEHPSPGVERYRFEDRGVDIDYNDVIVTVDHTECGVATLTAELGDAAWHHVIRAEVTYKGALKKDVLLWKDSQSASGDWITMRYVDDQKICGGTSLALTDVQVTQITSSSARVTWATDKETDSMVNYGVKGPSSLEEGLGRSTLYGFTTFEMPLVTHHMIILQGLKEGTKYHFRAHSADARGGVILSSDYTFTTLPDKTPPANVTNFTAKGSGAAIVLMWLNPTDADFAGVRIVKKANGFAAGPNDGVVVYDGVGMTTTDTKVTNGVTYYYAAYAYDRMKNYASGAIASETLVGAPDKTPPGAVTGFTAAPGNGRVLLAWVNPTAADFSGVRIMRKAGGFPVGVADGDVAYDGADTSVTDLGLENSVTYYYAAFAYDVAKNYAAAVTASATPNALGVIAVKAPPAPVTGLLATPGDAQVRLVWKNPTDTVGSGPTGSDPRGSGPGGWAGTRIVRNGKNDPTGPNDGVAVYEGFAATLTDTDLTNGTLYHYGAFAYDLAQNFALGAFANATPMKGASLVALSCTDTDGGQNYAVQGTVAANGAEYADSCVDETSVHENYCQNGARYLETHACGAGQKCLVGACVSKNFVLSVEKCGNGICAETENSVSCPSDCVKGEQVPPLAEVKVDVKPEEKLHVENLQFFATDANIPLRISRSGVQVYAGMAFRVVIPQSAVKKPIKEAFVNFAGSAYVMKDGSAAVVASGEVGTHTLTLQVTYIDGTHDIVEVPIVSVSRGSVYEMTDTRKNIFGARVTLLVDTGNGNYGVWDGTASGQQNPQMTDGSGAYAFIVPEGTYKLIAEKTAYLTKETLAFPVATENVITTALRLIVVPPPLDITNPESILENAMYGAKIAREAAKEVVQNPFVKEGSKNVGPAVVGVAAVNVGIASVATATTVPYFLYVYSFLAHPALLIAHRRRKKLGIVYNSLTKLPIDLAIVRLLDAKTRRVIQSTVTDKDGRYFFRVKPGEYKIAVVKAGEVFPSEFLRNQKEDALLVDLYHGEPIVVKEKMMLSVNIPLDPVVVTKSTRRIWIAGIGRSLQKNVGILSVLVLVVAAVIVPTPLTFGMLGANVVMFLVFRRIALPRKSKEWGIVYDGETKKPVKNVVARIFEAGHNRLLETQVTDVNGRYAFVIGMNMYYVTFEKPGYFKEQKGPVELIPLDEKKKDGAQVVAVDVPLLSVKGVHGRGQTPATVIPGLM